MYALTYVLYHFLKIKLVKGRNHAFLLYHEVFQLTVMWSVEQGATVQIHEMATIIEAGLNKWTVCMEKSIELQL